jgi:hypothetical protein
MISQRVYSAITDSRQIPEAGRPATKERDSTISPISIKKGGNLITRNGALHGEGVLAGFLPCQFKMTPEGSNVFSAGFQPGVK